MVKAVCRWCGGENVLIDACAVFDFEAQAWVLDSFDHHNGWCNTCDGGARVIEIDVNDKEWKPGIWHSGRDLAYRNGELDAHQEAQYEDDGGQ